MKASGAINRNRQRGAEARRLLESKTGVRRLSLLSPEQGQEAQEIMDLIYWGDLVDPDLEVIDETMEESSGSRREKRPSSKKETKS